MKKAINKQVWEQIADKWDEGIGEKGDIRHELVINPIVFQYLGNLKNKTVLDAGCGNGYISRKIAKTAKNVTAIDFTERLIEKAIEHSEDFSNIEYRVENLETLTLSHELFDVTLCNMVLMDVEHLEKAVHELARVTKKGGRIIISTQHPCFENAHKAYPLKNEDGMETGRIVTDYFTPGLVIDNNEGFPHYHWTMSQYLNAFSQNTLFLEEVAEPNNKEILAEKMTEVKRNHTPMFIIFSLTKLDS